MDHYMDITLLADPEFAPTFLMNALFGKCHRALARGAEGRIGVSFPKAGKTPGECLRLHGRQADLIQLMEQNWLKGMGDHIATGDIQAIPPGCEHRVVRRVQAKSSVARLLRRSVRKGWLTPEEAEKKLAQVRAQRLDLPFVQLKSGSSGKSFHLFFDQIRSADGSVEGDFSSYGLSSDATVPWF
jgi:CRISPR-associated endonuclease Csy4